MTPTQEMIEAVARATYAIAFPTAQWERGSAAFKAVARSYAAAALSAVPPMARAADEWQPIETAPFEDGDDVLVAIPVPWGRGWFVTTAYYLTPDKCHDEADAGWWRLGTAPMQSFAPLRKTYGEPMMWRPLPPPPAIRALSPDSEATR